MSKFNLHKNIFLKHLFLTIFFSIYNFPVFAQNPKTVADWTQPIKRCWEFKTEETTNIPLASDNDFIFVPTINKIKAINAKDGNMLWETETKGILNGKILISNKLLLINSEQIEKEQSFLNILDKETGIPQKQINLEIYPLNFQAVSDGNIISVGNNNIKAVNITNERVLFKTVTPNKILSLGIPFNSKIIFSNENRTLSEISILNGNILKQINIDDNNSYIYSSSLTDQILVGYKTGMLSSIENQNFKKNWNLKLGGEIIDIKNYGDKLLISSKDNFIYSIKAKNGSSVWRTKLPGRIIGSVLINQDTLLILSYGTESAILINPQNGKLINKINFGKDIYFVSEPIFVNDLVIIPTNIGIKAFSSVCTKEDGLL
jgi:outer membrane protein assembly factor BamB